MMTSSGTSHSILSMDISDDVKWDQSLHFERGHLHMMTSSGYSHYILSMDINDDVKWEQSLHFEHGHLNDDVKWKQLKCEHTTKTQTGDRCYDFKNIFAKKIGRKNCRFIC
jgi:hypothetical protein